MDVNNKNLSDGKIYVEGLDYTINLDKEHIFDSLNGAKILEGKNPSIILESWENNGYSSKWKIIIEQNEKLGEIIDRIPYGILDKKITGIGATTLEIETPVRNSIIVTPTKSLAYNKHKTANNKFGADYSLYVGSPIKEIEKSVSEEKILEYLYNRGDSIKKFIVVADSLPRLLKTLIDNGINVYKDYFLFVDEIDTLQIDSTYRDSLEMVIDYYFLFDLKMRCVVSATLSEFSNPLLRDESIVTTTWHHIPPRSIELIYTNYVDDIAIKRINELTDQSDDKILIAYNSIDGITNIFKQLSPELQQECGILCGERSFPKVEEFNIKKDEILNSEGRLSERIVFLTSAYFAGIDVLDRCHLVSITSYKQPFTYLSINRLTQISGRCRSGNISESIIYDIPYDSPYKDDKEIEIEGSSFKKNLLSKAYEYSSFLNACRKQAKAFPEFEQLNEFLESFIEYQTKILANTNYASKIIRQDAITNEFTPAFFNIDAALEKWTLKNSLYSRKINIKNQLAEQHDVIWDSLIIQAEMHNSDTIAQIKERNKERTAEDLETLIEELQLWYSGEQSVNTLNRILYNQQKRFLDFGNIFKRLYPYIEINRLLQDLKDNFFNRQKLRNYNNTAVFWALSPTNAFKSHVFTVFDYQSLSLQRNRRPGLIVTKEDKTAKMRSIFESQLFITNIDSSTLAQYFRCFFKTGRSGGNDRIIGLNPLDLPEPIQYIEDETNLISLFMYPND